MEQQINPALQRKVPRRRKRSKWQWFKETYLPLAIVGCALLLIIIFVAGSITRAVQKVQYKKQLALEASIAAEEYQAKLEREAATLMSEARALAATYDYEGAIEKISTFSGDLAQFPSLTAQQQEYEVEMGLLVQWEDNAEIPNLVFNILVEDPDLLPDANDYKQNLSTQAFSNILQQLYENDYVLIGLDGILDGVDPRPVMLPAGKKPIIITQKIVSYPDYTVGTNGAANKKGVGIANKLLLDENGNITSEYVDETGQARTGAYDLVPILEAFIYTHPDFSYKGARATLAVSGYNGLFGYQVQAGAKETLGEAVYQQEVSAARKLVQALRAAGYEIACGTYSNLSYGNATEEEVLADIDKWNTEIAPILGVVNTFVYARNSDLTGANTAYSGAKYASLQQAGFTRFLTTKNKVWLNYSDEYIRQGCIIVSKPNFTKTPDLFADYFDINEIP